MRITKKTISILIGTLCCILGVVVSVIFGGGFWSAHGIIGLLAILVVIKSRSWGGLIEILLGIITILIGFVGIAMYVSTQFCLMLVFIGCSWIVAAIFAWLYKPQTAA